MSSIAYITDQDMIEYHRLHGNNRIVYWRPSGQKKFQFFQHGDYLFFLTKGTEKEYSAKKELLVMVVMNRMSVVVFMKCGKNTVCNAAMPMKRGYKTQS